MIIDIRLRPPYGSFLKMAAPYGERGRAIAARAHLEMPPAARKASMPLLLSEMEAAGVTIGLVSGKAMEPGVPNAEVARICREYPGRFIGAANIDPDGEPTASADELRRCVQELGMRGLVLETGWSRQGITVDSRRLYPVYEEARRLQVPVFFTLSLFVGADIGYCQQSLIALDRVAGDFPD
ncbi:MAG: amidohydrolase family protein, partial [Lautropia sp.]